MGVEVTLKRGEPIERALKRLKRALDDEGIMKDLKERRHYVKPSDKKRKKSAQARSRRRKEALETRI